MKTLSVQQGTPKWAAIRARHNCASEAPIVMNASKYQSRSDLLRQKSTGLVPEVDAHKQALFDRGHAAEAAARVLVEELIGDDLSPITALSDDGTLLASLDGATLMGDVIFEHKLWSESLAAQVRAGELDPHYYWQLEQQLIVSGAEKVIFATSDGTRERFAHMEYRAVPGRAEQLRAAWAQFAIDLASYAPSQSTPAAVAAPVESLPAVSVRMDGALTVASNLPEFGRALRAFIAKIPAKPSTDQEFADCDAACKSLKKAEDALEAAESSALAGMASVEEMRRIVGDLRNLARETRLAREKDVKRRKEEIKLEQVQRGRREFDAHVAGLNARLGKNYLPPIATDFPGCISGLKKFDSLKDAIDGEIARAKIAASEIADRIQINREDLKPGPGGIPGDDWIILFPDFAQVCTKAPEDFRNLRIARVEAERQRREAEREKIRAEESAKLQREQEAREAEAARQAIEAAKPAPTPVPIVIAPPAVSSTAANVVPLGTRAPAESTATIRLGQINERLAPIQLSAVGMGLLGFKSCSKEGAAVLYRESDLPKVCYALIDLLHAVAQQQQAA